METLQRKSHMRKMMKRYIIAVYVENKSGVLTRVTSMFTRRGFNIDTLTVGATERNEYSRITVTLDGDENTCVQLVNQLKKLYVVKRVEVLDSDPIKRELMLLKVKNDAKNRRPDVALPFYPRSAGHFLLQAPWVENVPAGEKDFVQLFWL